MNKVAGIVLGILGVFVVLAIIGSMSRAPSSAILNSPPVQPETPAATIPITISTETPITLTGNGIQKTHLFSLAGGNYHATWEATAQERSSTGCYHGGTITAEDGRYGETISGGDSPTKAGETTTGETYLYRVPNGDYYLSMSSGCDWSVTIAPTQH